VNLGSWDPSPAHRVWGNYFRNYVLDKFLVGAGLVCDDPSIVGTWGMHAFAQVGQVFLH
jgi:hypothetical protein